MATRRGFLAGLLGLATSAVIPAPIKALALPKPSAMQTAFNMQMARTAEFTEGFYPKVDVPGRGHTKYWAAIDELAFYPTKEISLEEARRSFR